MLSHAHPFPSVRTRSRGKGFSLIEILIAMLILSIAIIAMADLFLYAIRKNAASSQTTRANQIAQDKLEELFSMDFSNMLVSNTVDCDFPSNPLGPVPVSNCWDGSVFPNPCPAAGVDVVTSITGYHTEGVNQVSIRQEFDRCWWILQGPQGFANRDQTRVLRVVVRPRVAEYDANTGRGRGFIGKAVHADISIIKAGDVGGAFQRN